MDNYVPIQEAAKKINLSLNDLNQLMQCRKIKSVMFNDQILLRESDVMALAPEDLFSDMAGKPIGIREASRKYSVESKTLSRWKDKGYVKVIDQIGQKILLDEASVARMVAYYATRPGRGRRTDIDLQR